MLINCNDKMEWEGIQFLIFPTILCQTQGAQGHMTHKDSTEHGPRLQEVVTEPCSVCQTLAFPVPLL